MLPGDRVLLDMQNGHDFVIACLAIMRADAVVVPVSPMNLTEELRHYIEDSNARVAITEHDLLSRFSGLPLDHVIFSSTVPEKTFQVRETLLRISRAQADLARAANSLTGSFAGSMSAAHVVGAF